MYKLNPLFEELLPKQLRIQALKDHIKDLEGILTDPANAKDIAYRTKIASAHWKAVKLLAKLTKKKV